MRFLSKKHCRSISAVGWCPRKILRGFVAKGSTSPSPIEHNIRLMHLGKLLSLALSKEVAFAFLRVEASVIRDIVKRCGGHAHQVELTCRYEKTMEDYIDMERQECKLSRQHKKCSAHLARIRSIYGHTIAKVMLSPSTERPKKKKLARLARVLIGPQNTLTVAPLAQGVLYRLEKWLAKFKRQHDQRKHHQEKKVNPHITKGRKGGGAPNT